MFFDKTADWGDCGSCLHRVQLIPHPSTPSIHSHWLRPHRHETVPGPIDGDDMWRLLLMGIRFWQFLHALKIHRPGWWISSCMFTSMLRLDLSRYSFKKSKHVPCWNVFCKWGYRFIYVELFKTKVTKCFTIQTCILLLGFHFEVLDIISVQIIHEL